MWHRSLLFLHRTPHNPGTRRVNVRRRISSEHGLRSGPTTLRCGGAVLIALGCGEECPRCPVRREDRRLDGPKGKPLEAVGRTWGGLRLVTERASARDRHGPGVRSCAGSETTSGEVRRHRTVRHELWNRQPRGARPCPGGATKRDLLVTVPRLGEDGQKSRCVSGSGPVARSIPSPPWWSRTTLRWPSQGARSAAVVRLEGAPHQARCASCRMLAAVRGLVLRTWPPLAHLVGWARPRACYDPAHGRANAGHEISPTGCSPPGQLPAYDLAFHRSHIVRSARTARVWIGAIERFGALLDLSDVKTALHPRREIRR